MKTENKWTNEILLGRLSLLLSLLAAGFGLIALLGWIFDIPSLSAFLSGTIPMAPSTALLFLLFGSILLLQRSRAESNLHSRLAVPVVWVITGLSVMVLILALRGIYLPVEYLGMDIEGAVDNAPIGHMSPITASLFLLVGCSVLFAEKRPRWLTLTAFAAALVIVILSMVLVVGYLVDAPLFYGTGTIPPAISTSLAFFFLGAGLLFSSGLSAWPPAQHGSPDGNGATITLLLAFLLLATGILATGYLYSQKQQKQFRTLIEIELSSIADMKVRELLQWRRERYDDGGIFYKNESFSLLVQRFFTDPGDEEVKRNLVAWLGKIVEPPQYRRVELLSAGGVEQLALPETLEAMLTGDSREIRVAVEERRTVLVDFTRKNTDMPPYLAVVVPLLATPDWNSVLGVLVLEIDPDSYLYPLIQNWPTPSESAETLLVRQDGAEVLFLNDLRFKEGAALNLRFPLSREDLPAAMAVRGRAGVVDGMDYRGKRVVAALRQIPDSPWFMVARMDLEEITEPLRRRLVVVALSLCLLLVGTGALLWLVWRNQKANFYRMRYEAAQALAESEQRLRLLFESSRDGILVANVHTRQLVVANDAMSRMLGYSRDELMTMQMSDIHPPAELPLIAEAFAKQARRELSHAVDIPMLCRDGSIFYADIYTTPIELDGQACLMGNFRDITERRRTEAQIEHLNRILLTLRSVNQLIVAAESADELIEKACALLADGRSYTGASIVLIDKDGVVSGHAEAGQGYDFNTLIKGLEQGRLPLCCEAAREKRGIHIVRREDPSCSGCALETTCVAPQKMSTPLLHMDTIYGYLMVNVDMDIIMDVEEEKLFAELAGDLSYSLHNMEVKKEMARREEETKKLEEQFFQAQKMEAVGQLAGGVAHDFNNLLSIILGFSDLLKEDMPPSSAARDSLEEIHGAALRAKDLTRQLLAFSRKQLLEMDVVDINDVVSSFESLLRRTIGENIAMHLDLTDEEVLVKADVSQMEQVLMNLVINARDALPDGGALTIATALVQLDETYTASKAEASPGPYVMIGVSDNGIGMDRATQEKIFEPFFTTKTMGKGTGLGLSTVFGVVKQHGGNIWVYSEPGQGTTFKIYLPSAGEAKVAEISKKAPVVGTGRAETVLVVEDEASLAKLVCQVLQRNGYTVLESNDVQHALVVAAEHGDPIDLLVTDVVMPTMNGTEVYNEVCRHHPQIKVLYMSGYTANVIAHHGVLDKGLHFLQKPFSADALLEKVHAALSN